MTQTLEVVYDFVDVTSKELLINKFPIQSITSVKYIDINGAEQTISNTLYTTDLLNSPCRVVLQNIPSMKDTINTLKIRFVAGYTSAANVPMTIKTAMYLLISHLYDNRQEVQAQALNEIPFGIKTILETENNRYNRTI